MFAKTARDRAVVLFGLLVAASLVIVAYLALSVLRINGGQFVYTLDDAYIHLALSDQIAAGHYGVNAGEYSSPSSSILYPFLLAAASLLGLHPYSSFIINVGALMITIGAIVRLLTVTGLADNRPAVLLSAALALFLAVFLNFYGVVFSGMEHSLQIAVTLWILVGLIALGETGVARWWLVAAIVICPLIRFEGLALAGVSILALAVMGRVRMACAAAIAIIVSFASYFALMIHLGLPVMPSSIMVKSSLAQNAVDGSHRLGLIGDLLKGVMGSFKVAQGRWMALLAIVVLLGPVINAWMQGGGLRRTEIIISCVVFLTLLAHLAAGQFGWFGRYELYGMALGIFSTLYLYRSFFNKAYAWTREHTFRAAITSVVIVGIAFFFWGVMGLSYFRVTTQTSAGSHNIYSQQFQMGRFVRDFYKQPVAVNDLGLVSYRTGVYVLDLWGLGSEPARKLRMESSGLEWISSLIAGHRIGLVMIYDEWFKSLPSDWVRVASLESKTPRLITAADTVSFYRTPFGDAEKIDRDLNAFSRSLPEGVFITRP